MYTASAPKKLNCAFSADDFVDAVYYDGVDVMSEVTNNKPKTSARTAKTITLEQEQGAVLAIVCRDNQGGNGAGFFFHCEDEQKSAAGSFSIVEGTRECKVLGGDTLQSAPSGWEKNEFDDSSWQAPERNKGPIFSIAVVTNYEWIVCLFLFLPVLSVFLFACGSFFSCVLFILVFVAGLFLCWFC